MKEVGGCIKNVGTIFQTIAVLGNFGIQIFWYTILYQIFNKVGLDLNLFWIYVILALTTTILSYSSIFVGSILLVMGIELEKNK